VERNHCEGGIPSPQEFEKVMDERFSPTVHEKLRRGRVGIAGLGGLGSHIAVMLARSGVGCLHLVDFDVVELSNLNRQAYRLEHLGMAKTQALSEELKRINPYLDIRTDQLRVTEQNAGEIFRADPIVCEAFDRPQAKAMLVNTLLGETTETVVIAGSGMAGYGSANAISSRRMGRRLCLCGDGTTDIDSGIGLMAARVSICAGHQANAAIRLLLGETQI